MTETTPTQVASGRCSACIAGFHQGPGHGGACECSCKTAPAEPAAAPAPSASLVAAIATVLASQDHDDVWQIHLDPHFAGQPTHPHWGLAKVIAGVAEPLLREQIAAEIEAQIEGPSWRNMAGRFEPPLNAGLRVAANIARGSAGSAATPETVGADSSAREAIS